MKAAKAAFNASVDGGITFFDTAEVYGSRVSKWMLYYHFVFRSEVNYCCQFGSSLLGPLTQKHYWEGRFSIVYDSHTLRAFIAFSHDVTSVVSKDLSRKGKKMIQKWKLLLQPNLQLYLGGWDVRVY
uniref:Putative oxidoreductase At1g06690ic isoform X1 n=1 Tax=Rhizophora mucronata TaxID=61149 RepID=A0A2P2L810_RHIMU